MGLLMEGFKIYRAGNFSELLKQDSLLTKSSVNKIKVLKGHVVTL